MKKIIVMCHADPNVSPRPNRMLCWLKDDFDVLAVSPTEAKIEDVRSLAYRPAHKNKYVAAFKQAFLRYFYLLLGQYEESNWQSLPGARNLIPALAAENADLIISHDLMLLPLAFLVKSKTAKVMLDAREYYPRNFSDNWFWRMTRGPVNERLCKTYLKMCDKVITVSPGLAEEYRREFGIDAEVVMSLPSRQDLRPSATQPGVIRMIHHGYANPSRRNELMLELMDYLDDRFTLDLMMMITDAAYWNKIVTMANARKNIRIVPPVPMPKIVETVNQYDIGLYLAFPTNFNVEYMLPNKLFEFIQARLAVAIGPSVEMKAIVEKYECGIVSRDFSPQSLAQELNKLDDEKIMALKQKSHQAALALNAEANGIRIREIVVGLMD